jgi:RNA polymerase sigma-70 factor (ECF subfamily)
MGELERLAQRVMDRAAGLALYARQWLADDAASAEDVVQEALTSLLAQHPPPRDPIAWMYRAVRNAAIDQSRSASRRRRREQRVAESRREWFEPRDDALIDAKIAAAALADLPPASREIVVLRIWSDLGFAQIADVMQMSLSSVHDKYVAALRQMRGALEKPCRSKNDTTTSK